MGIMDNEGHDPNGFGNRPNFGNERSLHAENIRLRALLREGLELSKSWEDWFARVRKELDHASHG